jgi:Flp pilus assembly protein TadD
MSGTALVVAFVVILFGAVLVGIATPSKVRQPRAPLLGRVPVDPDVAVSVARCQELMDAGDLEAAELELLAAEAYAPEVAEVQAAWGDLHFAKGQRGPAVERYDRAIVLDPGFAAAWSRRGICRHYLGEHALALSDLRTAQALDPTLPSIDKYLAVVEKAAR